MQNQQMPQWLDKLVTTESSKITKRAQEADDEAKIKELTDKINNAKTPEELDEIEKELQAIESKTSSNDSTDSNEDPEASSDEAGSDSDESSDEVDEEADLDKIMKEIKEIKSDVSGESLQKKLVNELEKLNDQLGLNKIVDLNSTVDTGM